MSLGGKCVEQTGDCKYTYGPADTPAGCLPEKYSKNRLIPPYGDHVKYFDWRDWHIISEIEDQGDPFSCGSCWSFSATSGISAWEAIRSGKTYNLSE